jgi:hypothetical protein
MTHIRQLGVCALAVCACFSAATIAAAANDQPPDPVQDAKAAAQVAQGPMIIERVHSGFLVAPDFKVTEVDHRTSEVAGAYAGWITDNTLLVGGGGYWLANGSRDREMAYGGLVVGWLTRTDRRFGFGAKALVGGGQATLSSTVGDIFVLSGDRDGPVRQSQLPTGRTPLRPVPNARVRFHEGFFIAEPEANLLVNLTRRLRLAGGVGYRLIGGARGTDDRLRGVTGSVALQIGGGS